MDKVLMKGNEAIGEAALRAGCRYFFGYPITPQSELPEYLSRALPEAGGVYLQAESEIGGINMVFGAASTGARVMTSSSGPGISLKQEGISYIAGSEVPCVIVNIMRCGPGLGGIQPSQSDYFQATRGGGHGDYRIIVLGPASVQEAVDLVTEAFDLAEKYRTPVMILGDGILGQMMEPVEFKEQKPQKHDMSWTVSAGRKRKKNLITSLYLDPEQLERHNLHLDRKYNEIKAKETRAENYRTEDAEIVLAAYGLTARICKAAADLARKEGIRAGVFRPITLWPYPDREINAAVQKAGHVLTVEMSTGQMVEDVRLALNGRLPVSFYGRTGGMVPTARAVFEEIRKIHEKLGGQK